MNRNAREQFGRQAEFYAVSRTHSHADSLANITELAHPQTHQAAVDIGTGPGFTAFAIAPFVRLAIATDPALPMLRQAKRLSAERRLDNIQLALLVGEALPFADGSLDLVTCRQAFHHFTELNKAISEIHRTLKPGGTLVLGDTISPENNDIARWLDDIERRRDPTHVYNLKVSEWRDLLASVGFQVGEVAMSYTFLEFGDWTRRSAIPEEEVTRLRHDFLTASPGVASHFHIAPSGEKIDFTWDAAVIQALKPA